MQPPKSEAGPAPASPRGDYPGKRALDLALALPAVLLLLPVMAAIALAVRLAMGRPVLFAQERPGRSARPFRMLKFRTMSDARGTTGVPLADGDRITSLGRFLRRTSLDELPELLNVVRGDMSLVGPRPLLFRYLPHFRPRERTRLIARPGVTGLAQVSGRNFVCWDARLELDAVYVETMSLRGDLAILLRTAWQVLRGHGVSVNADLVEPWLDEERAVVPPADAATGAAPDGRMENR